MKLSMKEVLYAREIYFIGQFLTSKYLPSLEAGETFLSSPGDSWDGGIGGAGSESVEAEGDGRSGDGRSPASVVTP